MEDGASGKKSGEEEWLGGEEDKAWNFGEEDEDDGVFDLKEESLRDFGETRDESESSFSRSGSVAGIEESKKLEEEEKQLTAVLKGKLFLFIFSLNKLYQFIVFIIVYRLKNIKLKLMLALQLQLQLSITEKKLQLE